MNDPYSVLGISRGATDDEIKKAYRALSRKYHPDANINNPNKDQAEAKFKEVQQAYQQIMHEREYGTTGSYGNGYGSSSGGYDGNNPNDLTSADVTSADLTLEDLTLEDSETSAVTPVSISRDDPAQPVTKVTFICRPLPISLITAATKKQSMS